MSNESTESRTTPLVSEDALSDVIKIDVVIVGFGLSGASAAIRAHDAGARVLIVEKMPQSKAGGNSRVSGQALFLPENVDAVMDYQRNLNEPNPIPEAVLRWWAGEMVALREWLEPLVGQARMHLVKRDIPFNAEFPDLDTADSWVPLDTIARELDGQMESSGVWEAFRRGVDRRNIDVWYESTVADLIVDDERCVGVRVNTHAGIAEVHARGGVVLCLGGYENDRGMQQNYHGTANVHTCGTPGNTGDGIRMLQRVGADLWHMRNANQTAGFWPSIAVAGYTAAFMRHTKLTEHSWLDIAEDGYRFCDEAAYWNHTHYREKQHGVWRDSKYAHVGRVHMIFDEKTRLAGPIILQRLTWNTVVEGYEWSQDNGAEVARGWIAKADSIADLADTIGRDPGQLASVVNRYNDFAVTGRDLDFGREPRLMRSLATPPFYAVELIPAVVATTGGARREVNGAVVDQQGVPIAGLYAAGEGGSIHSNLYQSGALLTEAMISGRAAGAAAAQQALARG